MFTSSSIATLNRIGPFELCQRSVGKHFTVENLALCLFMQRSQDIEFVSHWLYVSLRSNQGTWFSSTQQQPALILRMRLCDRSLVTNRRPTNACALSSPVVLLKTVDLLIPMSVKLDFAPINQLGRLQCGVNGVWEAQVDLGMRPLCGGSAKLPIPTNSNQILHLGPR